MEYPAIVEKLLMSSFPTVVSVLSDPQSTLRWPLLPFQTVTRRGALSLTKDEIDSLRIGCRRSKASSSTPIHRLTSRSPSIAVSISASWPRGWRVTGIPISITGIVVKEGGSRVALVKGGGAESAADEAIY